MRKRQCLQCFEEMQPTKKMWDCDGAIPNPTHRIFKCCECGFEAPWLDKPKLNGTCGELHHIDGTYSGLSMMSDPAYMKTSSTTRIQIKMFQE